MCFQDFELLTDKEFTVRCKTCGEEMPTGIVNLSTHWSNCSGKGFHDAIMDLANKTGGKLTLTDVTELQNIHLK